MAEIRVKFNIAMVLAVLAAEIVSVVIHYSPWYHSLGHRNIIAAIIADCVLVYILKLIKE